MSTTPHPLSCTAVLAAARSFQQLANELFERYPQRFIIQSLQLQTIGMELLADLMEQIGTPLPEDTPVTPADHMIFDALCNELPRLLNDIPADAPPEHREALGSFLAAQRRFLVAHGTIPSGLPAPLLT